MCWQGQTPDFQLEFHHIAQCNVNNEDYGNICTWLNYTMIYKCYIPFRYLTTCMFLQQNRCAHLSAALATTFAHTCWYLRSMWLMEWVCTKLMPRLWTKYICDSNPSVVLNKSITYSILTAVCEEVRWAKGLYWWWLFCSSGNFPFMCTHSLANNCSLCSVLTFTCHTSEHSNQMTAGC